MSLDDKQSRAVGAANMFWVLVGPGLLSIFAIIAIETRSGWFSLPSLAFLVVLIGVAVAQWLDPMNSDGTPTTPRQRSINLLLTMTLGLAGWVAMNVLRDYWMTVGSDVG